MCESRWNVFFCENTTVFNRNFFTTNICKYDYIVNIACLKCNMFISQMQLGLESMEKESQGLEDDIRIWIKIFISASFSKQYQDN